ncbi:MAG: Hpt domain-containing protein [Phycisphaerae bacterium]|nr:Hpt domain-containing protein [Phycisphaerae bacterium]
MSSVQQPATEKLVSQLLEEDPDLLDVVEEFVKGLEQRLEEIKQAYEQLDWDQLTTVAHRLKGAGGSYGYPDISELCAKMEQAFRAQMAGDYEGWMTRLTQLVHAAEAGLD